MSTEPPAPDTAPSRPPRPAERTLDVATGHHLLGATCHATGTLWSVRYSNPFTKSDRPHRQWMVLLKRVIVGGLHVDHLWLSGCHSIRRFRNLPVGTEVSLLGRCCSYRHTTPQGAVVEKWTLKAPYTHVHVHEHVAPEC